MRRLILTVFNSIVNDKFLIWRSFFAAPAWLPFQESLLPASPFRGEVPRRGDGGAGVGYGAGSDLAAASTLAPPQSRLRSPAPPEGEAFFLLPPLGEVPGTGDGGAGVGYGAGSDLAAASTLAPPQSRLRSPAPPEGEAKRGKGSPESD